MQKQNTCYSGRSLIMSTDRVLELSILIFKLLITISFLKMKFNANPENSPVVSLAGLYVSFPFKN